MEDEDVRELCELERLLRDGFITREQHRERAAQLKEAIRVRKALAKQRKAERKREQEAEEKLWEERDRKLMLERREEEMKLKEQKKKELTRAVLQGSPNPSRHLNTLGHHLNRGTCVLCVCRVR
jgi:CHASE3 domain sensor protein